MTRRTAHVVAALAGWVGLGALWAWQLGLGVPRRWAEGPALALAVFALWVCLLVLWVAHSRGIYRRRHRRTTPVRLQVGFREDSLGRRVRADPGTVAAHRVEISVSLPGVKEYEPVDRPRTETEEVA